MQRHQFVSFGKRNPLSFSKKMKGGLNMSLIQNAVEMANKSGLGHFMYQDPVSNERRTSRVRRTSRKQRRTSRVRRTSRKQQRRTSRVRRTSRQQRRRNGNSFWNDLLF